MKPRIALITFLAFFHGSFDFISFERKQRTLSLVSANDAEFASKNADSFEFQAEVHRLMDIIINSLYKSKEIFLREVISNASDALDKLRFLSVSDETVLSEGDPELKIQISADKDARILTITDTGIGMTRAELIANLGTMAKSGTTNFVEALGETGDLSLIGQFGVGFYSVYLVADRVEVISKHAGDIQHIWESTADSTFTVREDPRGNTLGRGTQIILHIKDDADEFLEEQLLSDLIHRYSEFITFPIYQMIEVDKVKNDSDNNDEVEISLDDEEDDEEDEEEETESFETKTADSSSIKLREWQRVNKNTPIWARSNKDVSDEEYQSFYRSISKDSNDALAWTHFKAEGEVDFKSILFIPSAASFDHYNKYYETEAGLKLYVRKVLIKDDFEDLLPRYLNFIRGVVDSDALPLNVSRETLQQQKALQVIGKKLVRKALEMLKKLSDESISISDEINDSQNAQDNIKDDKYLKFWEEYGRNIKLGAIEDNSNKQKLLKLLRFKTSKSDGKWISLDQYVVRMKEWQKDIYFVSAESYAAVEKSPFLDKLKKKDLEVLYITEPTDEYCMQHTKDYEGHKIMAASKEGLKFGDEDESKIKALSKHYKNEYKPLTDYLKELYSNKISKVIVSKHLSSAPFLIITPQYGYTANMERIIKSQTFSDEATNSRFSQRSMEINPLHPIVSQLNKMVSEDKESKSIEDLAWLLYDTAMAASGFSMEDSSVFSDRMYRVIGERLNIASHELMAEPEISEEIDEEEESIDSEIDDDIISQFMDADTMNSFNDDEEIRDEL